MTMTAGEFMRIDAVMLVMMWLCAMAIAQEDESLGWFQRATVLVAGFCALAQALWLVGIWVPSAAGYPWPRLTLDGAFCLAAITRTWIIVKRSNCAKRAFKQRVSAASLPRNSSGLL